MRYSALHPDVSVFLPLTLPNLVDPFAAPTRSQHSLMCRSRFNGPSHRYSGGCFSSWSERRIAGAVCVELPNEHARQVSFHG
jgi:hypothetical protein